MATVLSMKAIKVQKKKDDSSVVQEVVEASELPWKLSVHVTTSKSKLIHTKAVEERVRDVIGNVLGINGLNEKDKNKEEPVLKRRTRTGTSSRSKNTQHTGRVMECRKRKALDDMTVDELKERLVNLREQQARQ